MFQLIIKVRFHCSGIWARFFVAELVTNSLHHSSHHHHGGMNIRRKVIIYPFICRIQWGIAYQLLSLNLPFIHYLYATIETLVCNNISTINAVATTKPIKIVYCPFVCPWRLSIFFCLLLSISHMWILQHKNDFFVCFVIHIF